MRLNSGFNFKMYQQDWYLLIIFIMMAVAIVIKSYFSPNGYLSPDSTNYLKLAQNLLEGKGYYVSAYGNTGQDREFFAIWPIGYPTFIFLVAKLTGLSVFWASKLLNIVLVGVILGIFRALFKYNAYVYGLIFFFSAYIEIFSFTWSETVFIFALVWFATSIYLFITNPKNGFLLYLSIIAASLLLFMSRYIGAFSFGLIGFLGLYYGLVKKDKTKAMILIGIAIVNIGLMVLYLYHNYIETGFLTGMKRIPSPETNLQLLISLIKALAAEATIPIMYGSYKWLIFQFVILIFIVLKYKKSIINMMISKKNTSLYLSVIFSSIGIVYLFFIILMRWISQFDGYNYRLLGPGSFLIFVGIISFIQQRGTEQIFKVFKNILLFFAILSYLVNVPYTVWVSSKHSSTYFQTLEVLKEKYEDVKKDSIVIFGSKHLNYLYMDMQTRSPFYLPYSSYKENWSDFMKRIDPKHKKNIYLSTPRKELTSKKYDQSVVEFVKQYDKDTVVKLQ